MSSEMMMVQGPIKLISRKEILIQRHNELLNAIVRNEIEIKVLDDVLKEYEKNPPTDSNLEVGARNTLEELLLLIDRQKLQLQYTQEALVDESEKEEKENN